MTHASDELLSALIDGEASPSDDVAHVDACVPCQERLELLRTVAVRVGAPVPAPAAHVREAAVAAALVETTGVAPAVRRLTPRHKPAHARPRRMNTLSAAAAFVVALAVGGFLVSQVGRDTANDASTTSNAALREADAAERAQADAEAAATADDTDLFSTMPAGGGTGGGPYYEAGAIGAFDDVEGVAAKYREYEAAPGPATATERPQCPSPDDQVPVWHASLTYKGEAAFARVRWATESAQVLEVLRRTDCVLLASQALEPTTPR